MHSEGEHTPHPPPNPSWAHKKIQWAGPQVGNGQAPLMRIPPMVVLCCLRVLFFCNIFFELLEWGSKRAWKGWIKYMACQGLFWDFNIGGVELGAGMERVHLVDAL